MLQIYPEEWTVYGGGCLVLEWQKKKKNKLIFYLSHQLSVDFGDAIDGARSLHAQIWRRVSGRGGSEGTNGAGDKQTQAVLRGNVQDVVKP